MVWDNKEILEYFYFRNLQTIGDFTRKFELLIATDPQYIYNETFFYLNS
jgi:hypothetical protein